MPQRTYLPAAGHDWLLPLYDPFVKVFGGESAHRRLIDQAQPRPGQRVLEIGCGTGSLSARVKGLYPTVDVVGLDPDPKALERALQKARRRRVSLQLDRGFSDALPYPDGSYDRVLSAFMFHHLTEDEKKRSLLEIRRVLRPGGSLHLLDFGGAHGHAGNLIAHVLHQSERLHGNSADTLLSLMRETGFTGPELVAHQRTMLGQILFYRACRPALAD
jgi:ubiquinone/menaquinone biosynthesis C-methylase UbiE